MKGRSAQYTRPAGWRWLGRRAVAPLGVLLEDPALRPVCQQLTAGPPRAAGGTKCPGTQGPAVPGLEGCPQEPAWQQVWAQGRAPRKALPRVSLQLRKSRPTTCGLVKPLPLGTVTWHDPLHPVTRLLPQGHPARLWAGSYASSKASAQLLLVRVQSATPEALVT